MEGKTKGRLSGKEIKDNIGKEISIIIQIISQKNSLIEAESWDNQTLRIENCPENIKKNLLN